MSQFGRTFSNSGPGGFVQSLTTDDGHVVTPLAGTINLHGDHGLNTTGTVGPNTATVSINNSIVLGDLTPIPQATDAITLTTGDLSVFTGNINFFVNSNPAGGSITLGGGPFMTNFGSNGVTLGTNAGGSGTGFLAASNGCVAIGDDTLFSISNTQFCTAVGYISMPFLTTGVQNTGLGAATFNNLLTGSNSIAIGYNAASAYTTSESDNIVIGHVGIIGDNGVTRIGTNASQTTCFVAGIDAVDLSTANVVTEVSDQLGTAVLTAGTGISITPGAGVITIAATGGGGPIAFFATLNAAQNGVTGSGTDYVIPFDQVEFNDGGGFSVDTFTAPIDGRYLFTWSFYMQNCLNTNISGFAQLRTSVGTFQNDEFNPYLEGFTANGYFLRNFTNIVQLTAGQTARCAIRVFFNGTDNINLVGIADTGGFATSFSGHLIK